MRMLSRFFALVLSLALLLAAVSCDNFAKDVGSNDALDQVTYPLISYLPHYASIVDDRWVSVRFDTLDELSTAREILIAHGVSISDEKRVAFDYRSDELVVKYWFDGILTLESAKLTGTSEYYELDYFTTTLESYIYYNDIETERKSIYGPHSYTYVENMYGFAHSRISAVKGAVIPDNIDTDKLVLHPPIQNDIKYHPRQQYVSYNGENIIEILTYTKWTDEFFEKVKHTLVVY